MLTQHCSAAQSKKQVVHLFTCLLHLENKMEKVDSFWQNRYLQRLLLLLKWWFLLRDGNVLLHSSSPVWEHFTAQKYIFSQFQDVGQKTTFQTLKKAEKISCETPFSNSKQGAEDFSHFLGKISACSSSWFFLHVSDCPEQREQLPHNHGSKIQTRIHHIAGHWIGLRPKSIIQNMDETSPRFTM